MKDFMYIIRGGDENMTDMSPEEMENIWLIGENGWEDLQSKEI